MGSEFNTVNTVIPEEELFEVSKGKSDRFRFFKVRLYGVLHFVKMPSEEYADDLLTLESLRKEFIIGYSLHHPSTVRYLRLENGALFQEFIDGKTLREMMEERDYRLWKPGFFTEVCLQLLDALDYMHGEGIVHLDLKPENIMITRIGNNVKIIDFGCAQSAANDSTPGYTVGYKAPEQGNGTVNTYTDIFQVGKIMEELSCLTGDEKRWRKFIDKSTADNYENRFGSAREAIAMIPRRRNGVIKSVLWVTVIFLTGFMAGFLFFYQNGNINDGNQEKLRGMTSENNVEMISKQSKKSKIEEESVSKVSDRKKMMSEEDIERELSRKINKFADQYFKEKVYPNFQDILEGRRVRMTYEQEEMLTRIVAKGYDDAMKFEESLYKTYPDSKMLIEGMAISKFETKFSMLAMKLYP